MAEHVRIDEGVKRGPKRRPIRNGLPTNKAPKADLGTWHIPPDLDPKEVIERYLTESTTSQIAAEYGLSRKALTKWLREKLPNEWKTAQILRALCRKEDAEDGLECATDALSLARARELHRAAQFDLSALDPDYRPAVSVAVSIDHQVSVEHSLTTSAAELLSRIRNPVSVPIEARAEDVQVIASSED